MRWTILDPAPEALMEAVRELPRPVVDAAFHRGQKDADALRRFLEPNYARDSHDPFLFSDMERACSRLYAALDARDPILIHGDYDADGICATAILASLLKMLGGIVYTFLPTRDNDGYGVSMRAVEQAIRSGVRLLITADCGVAAHEQIARAASAGIDVIVVDHHRVADTLPSAFAMLHPLVADQYPDRTLTGGGVAFKLAQAMIRSSEPAHRTRRNRFTAQMGWGGFEKWLLDLAAISTIADCAALTGESRMMVRFGLTVLGKTLRPGLRALYAQARIGQRPITEETIKFAIAPRINAAGRLKDPKLALALLLAPSLDVAGPLASSLEQMNVERQQLTQSAIKDIEGEVGDDPPPVVFTYRADWRVGLISLLASRITHTYDRPSFVLCRNNGDLIGSTRGVDGFDCVAFLKQAHPLLKRFGGHTHAAGFTLEPEQLDAFRSLVAEYGTGLGQPEKPALAIDGVVSLGSITSELAAVLGQFAPFGIGNGEPVFASEGVRFVGARRVGQTGSHVQGTLVDSAGQTRLRAVGFGMGGRMAELTDRAIDAAYHIRRDTWNGETRVQAVLVDVKESS